jgi:hypothetical protein
MYSQPEADVILKFKELKEFALRSRTRQKCLLLPLLFSIILEYQTRGISQEMK